MKLKSPKTVVVFEACFHVNLHPLICVGLNIPRIRSSYNQRTKLPQTVKYVNNESNLYFLLFGARLLDSDPFCETVNRQRDHKFYLSTIFLYNCHFVTSWLNCTQTLWPVLTLLQRLQNAELRPLISLHRRLLGMSSQVSSLATC